MVFALAMSYAALLCAHSVDPDDEEDTRDYHYDDEDEHSVEYLGAEEESHGGDSEPEAKGPVAEDPPPPRRQEGVRIQRRRAVHGVLDHGDDESHGWRGARGQWCCPCRGAPRPL